MARTLATLFFSAISLLLCLAYLLSLDTPSLGPFFNSDALYLAALSSDILSGYSLAEWYLTPAPYFFPDALFYLAVAALTDSLQQQVLVTALTQYLMLTAVAALLYRRLGISPLLAGAGPALLLMVAATGSTEVELLFAAQPIFISAHHFSAFVLTLLVLRPADGSVTRPGLFLLLLTVLMTASDLLFVLTAVIPLALLHCYQQRQTLFSLPATDSHRWQAAATPVLLAITVLAGLLLKRLLMPENTTSTSLQLDLARMQNAMPLLLQELRLWFGAKPIVAISWSAGVLLMLIQAQRSPQWRTLLALWLIANLLTVVAQLTVTDRPQIRYLQFMLYLPVLLLPGWALLLPRGQAAVAALAASLMLGGTVALWPPQPAQASLLNFYPPITRCLDKAAQQYQLSSGVTDYWSARHHRMLAHAPLSLNPVTDQLQPYYWIINAQDYQAAPPMQFVLFDTTRPQALDRDSLRRLAGPADRVEHCPGAEIWIYQQAQLDAALRTRLAPILFRYPGDQRQYPAASLPTAAGQLKADYIASTGQPGTLVYGPYQAIAAGDYQARYLLEGEATEGLRWDAVLHDSGKEIPLASGELSLPADGRQTVTLPFTSPQTGTLEIRLFVDARHQVNIHRLELTRTD